VFGRKQTPSSRTLAQRVHRIATAPTFVPTPQPSRAFGKRDRRLAVPVLKHEQTHSLGPKAARL
jgi:hypothetical protein